MVFHYFRFEAVRQFGPKYQPKIFQISALPSYKLPGQKSGKFLVDILRNDDLLNSFEFN